MHTRHFLPALLACLCLWLFQNNAAADDAALELFESSVRPILVDT